MATIYGNYFGENRYKTLEQTVQEKLLFRHFVPPTLLGVVFRGTRFCRFLHPGIANRKPRFGRESLLGHVNLETIFLPFECAGVLSKDGYLFKVEGTLAYSYDPRISTNLDPFLEYLIKALTYRKALDQPILAKLNQQLHIAIGNQTAVELMSGIRSSQIEHKVARTLGRDLKDLGVKLDPHSSLVIDRLVPPIQLREAHQRGLAHFLEAISGLSNLTEEERNQLVQINLSKNGNTTFFVGNNELANAPILIPNFAPIRKRSGRVHHN
ncbi:MAG: hypothetical protein ACI9EW_001910 [Cellvibrionaceae bacterium]|jgi:hypothetical protein